MAATRRVVHGPGVDEPLWLEAGGAVYAYHADALGSITGVSDASGALVEASTYTSFGELSRTGGVAGNGYAYTGREVEPELGLYYYRARYYDPAVGRFLSRDPIGFEGGDITQYVYSGNDPINDVDPEGLGPLGGRHCKKCGDYMKQLREASEKCRAEEKACKTLADDIRFMDKYGAVSKSAAIFNCTAQNGDPAIVEKMRSACSKCGSPVTGPWPPRPRR